MATSDAGSSRRKAAERSDRRSCLPHDQDREERQPYAREVEDYKHGVAAPPEEQVGREPNRTRLRERTDK
jgi:hypothetical protein